MTPNPSYFLAFSFSRTPPLGVPRHTFRATPDDREPQQRQSRGEALVVFEGASSHRCA
jgi:hypothetical protein